MEKIIFPKKLWWSITKPSKYDEMMKTGLKQGIKYFFALVAIMSLILSLVGTYIQSVEIQKIGKYVEENVPEFKIENTAKEGEEANYKLNLENNEVIILDNQDFISAFKSTVVVNTNLKESEAIEEYYKLATDENYCIVLLEDECIIISSKYNPENEEQEEGIIKYSYEEVLKNYIGSDVTEFDKQDLAEIFNNVAYTYYIIAYFVNYFMVLLVLFAFDIIILGIISMIIGRILKKDSNRRQLFSLSIYSYTLPIILYIIYLIINYFARFNIAYINFAIMLIAFVYVILYFYRNKKQNIA